MTKRFRRQETFAYEFEQCVSNVAGGDIVHSSHGSDYWVIVSQCPGVDHRWEPSAKYHNIIRATLRYLGSGVKGQKDLVRLNTHTILRFNANLGWYTKCIPINEEVQREVRLLLCV